MPSRGLVLSLFPGIGMFDRGFEEEGFCVVRGPDVLWGGDVRTFHPPGGGVFQGMIGGDPCQSHSSLANLVRAKGLEPRFPDMTPEFQRVIEEGKPDWFLRENTPRAPDIEPAGYDVRSFLLDLSHLDSGDGTGHEQMRKRRFWFGVRDDAAPELRQWIDFALFELPDVVQTVAGDSRASFIPGGQAEVNAIRRGEIKSVPRTKTQAVGTKAGVCLQPGPGEKEPRRSLAEMLELQGFPPDWLEHQPWTMQAKRQMVGNGVPLAMSRALARAVVKALEKEERSAESR